MKATLAKGVEPHFGMMLTRSPAFTANPLARLPVECSTWATEDTAQEAVMRSDSDARFDDRGLVLNYMATGLVIHISSGDDRHTEILTEDKIRIGACDTCDLRLRSSSVPKTLANTVLLELTRANGSSYRVTDFARAVPLILNGAPVAEGAEIRDGDEVQIGRAHV
jgi:hypothetical protein